MRKIKTFLSGILLALFTCLSMNSVQAANAEENVSVTVPTSIFVSFEATGTTSISEFEIRNQSLVPVTVGKIYVTEHNGWKLGKKSEDIPVNTKKLVFMMEKQCLQLGENIVDIRIPEESGKKIDIQVERGAWTDTDISETALSLEIEYTFGRKEFQLNFDANGGNTNTASMTAYNGDVVTLPEAEKEGCLFQGWQDEKGNLYTSEYVMSIGNVTLTARWQETEAYAVYSQADHSLTFYRSEKPISVGDTYNGKEVTAVYTGVEKATYMWTEIPWYSYHDDITSVIFEDKVSPINTDYWFKDLRYAQYADVENLDMSNVTSMEYMFSYFGCFAPELIFDGLENWNVSKVTNMFMAFDSAGCGVAVQRVYVGDLSNWDVSNVTTMLRMFCTFAYNAPDVVLSGLEKWDTSKVTNMSRMFYNVIHYDTDWKLDLSGWDVRSIEYHSDFNENAEGIVVPPAWLN